MDSGPKKPEKKPDAQAYDPICGARVVVAGAEHSADYKKRRYVFCSAKCRQAFARATERLRIREEADAGALFTPGKISWGIA